MKEKDLEQTKYVFVLEDGQEVEVEDSSQPDLRKKRKSKLYYRIYD